MLPLIILQKLNLKMIFKEVNNLAQKYETQLFCTLI